MQTRLITFFILLILPWPVLSSQDSVLRTAAEISRQLGKRSSDTTPFVLTAKVTAVRRTSSGRKSMWNRISALGLEDESGATLVYLPTASKLSVVEGDLIRAEGKLAPSDRQKQLDAFVTHLTKIGHADPVTPLPASFQTIQNGSLDYRIARISGTVRDASRSDSCREWVILKLVIDKNQLMDVSVLNVDKGYDRLLSLIGSTVQIDGIVVSRDRSLRTKMGRILWCWTDRNVRRISSPSDNPHVIPDISALNELHPSIILRKSRHKAVGRVLATWHGNNLLIRTTQNEVCRIELAEATLPACGDTIEAIGFPESNLYHINLVRASWVKSSVKFSADEPPVVNVPEGIVVGKRVPGVLDVRCHGCPIRFCGIIRSLPGSDGDGVMCVQDGQTTISVDVSSNPHLADQLTIGCRVRTTGICVIDTPNWTPNALCQKLDRFILVIRTPDDIEVLDRPSWWTPGKLLTVIGAMLAVLAGVFIWNRMLNRIADRRGRALLREQIKHIRADLKVDERTRLAVDLHDSLSQNLTGIAMQLDLVGRLSDQTDAKVARHLDIAARTLQSCRNELRSCIWDLRNQALDEPSMEEAVRRVLLPHLDATRLTVRFPISRSKISDNTAHTTLRIVRELVSNAVRHGKAKNVRVAGALENGTIRMSVQDDGIGFDPDRRPSIRDGHFGLDGIRERIRHFNGRLDINSRPGKGARIVVSLDLPCDERKDTEPHG